MSAPIASILVILLILAVAWAIVAEMMLHKKRKEFEKYVIRDQGDDHIKLIRQNHMKSYYEDCQRIDTVNRLMFARLKTRTNLLQQRRERRGF